MAAKQQKADQQYDRFDNPQHAGYNQAAPQYTAPQHTAPQYTAPQQYGGVPQVKVQPNTGHNFVVDIPAEPWTHKHLVTSMIGFFCCSLCGFIGTVMSILSYVDHGNKEYEKYKSKKGVACGFGVAAIVIGSLITLLFIIIYAAYYATIIAAAVDASNHLKGQLQIAEEQLQQLDVARG